MAEFLDENFLLRSDKARVLYHDYAKEMPIIDYHSHLPPAEVARNESFRNLAHIWLAGDHYKWRAMRTLGIAEHYITGEADDRTKFRKWAEAVPYTVRNPLYHWTHMELKNPFGIQELLAPATADRVYDEATELLQTSAFRPQGLLRHFNVQMVGTTDDPADSLEHHQKLREAGFETKILPSFRPDKACQLSKGDAYRSYIQTLQSAAGISINDLDSLVAALAERIDFFHDQGCRISDHGLEQMPRKSAQHGKLATVFKQVLEGNDEQAAAFESDLAFYVLFELGKLYHAKGWVQQFHLGPIRNNNTRKLRLLGPDTGFDSIGDFPQAENMSRFLNALEEEDALAKTIIYNVNPADNAVFASMTGNFQGEGVKGKIQFGSGWWFLDQLDGMTQQLTALSTIGLISSFVGMLTDSRSFLSYSRHEYFRRLLCNLFADDIENGLLPDDEQWIGKIIQDISYNNAREYFDF